MSSRRALLAQNRNLKGKAFTLLIDTTKAGTPVGFTIPVASGETYLYDVDWGDGITTANHTGSATHTYSSDGVYEVRITGTFPRIYFNDTGDKLKVIEILNLGQTGLSTNQTNAFFGGGNLIAIPTHSSGRYNSIINGSSMFRDTSLTNLPSQMLLHNLTSGGYMFQNTLLESLPDSMILGNLTSGGFMFYQANLQSLPSTMTLASLTAGYAMFQGNDFTSLPSGMILNNLTQGSYMFTDVPITTLPSGMTLASLLTGGRMFRNNSLTDLPSGITLANLTDGTNMFEGNTINTTRYSQLLIDMNANNSNNNVPFHGGNSKYNSAGETARNALIARGWTITDGGLEV